VVHPEAQRPVVLAKGELASTFVSALVVMAIKRSERCITTACSTVLPNGPRVL
jgi:hypothetical protein